MVLNMKKSKEYNIIIYTCLLLAIILLVLGGRDYLKDLNKPTQEEIIEPEGSQNEVERPEDVKKEKEPEDLQKVDKEGVIKKYLDSLYDQIKKDKKIPYKIIKTWGKYSVGEIEYQRKITSNYYEYKVNINIPNKNAKLPCPANEELSTEEYTVITIYVDIVESDRQKGYIVKNIDLIEAS